MSDAEVVDLTGYRYPKCQSRWLRDNGIKHYINGRGKVRVSRDALASKKSATTERTVPDFSKVRRRG